MELILGRFRVRSPVVPKWASQLVADRMERVQGGKSILEDHLHCPRPGSPRPPGPNPTFDAVQEDVPPGRLMEPGDQAGDGRLAAPGLAHKGDNSTGIELEGNMVHCVEHKTTSGVR